MDNQNPQKIESMREERFTALEQENKTLKMEIDILKKVAQMVSAVGTKVYCKILSTILPTLQIFQLYSVQLLAVLRVPQ